MRTGADYVLIVDDEDAVRQLLSRWLTGWGYRVQEAANGADAVEQMAARPASIVLTDVLMPVQDGLWLTAQVRKRWPQTAIIIASGVDDLHTAEALRKEGAVDYVTKPLGREPVRQALERAEGKAAMTNPGLVAPVAPSSAPAATRRHPTMKLIDRKDTSLSIALIVGTVMIFNQPLRFLFDIAADIETKYHLDLIPALSVFAVVFGFHQYRKQQDARYASESALEEARRANERSEELERMVGLGRDLANAVTLEMIRPVLWEYLPSLGVGRDFWILVQSAGRWESLTGDRAAFERQEEMAGRTLTSEGLTSGQAQGTPIGDVLCYPMVVANAPIGVLGVPAAGLSDTTRRRIGAAAALLAIAIKNAQLFQQSQDKGTRDSLTGCFNRGYTVEAIEAELRRAKRTNLPLSLLIFDVDHFKTINDRYGHLAGDRVLVEVAQRVRASLRASDIKCRYGGDEFVMVLPETDLGGAAQVAENLRQAICRGAILLNNESVFVTISTGVAAAVAGEVEPAKLIERADQALYSAKQSGRNLVGVAPAGKDSSVH